MTDQHLAPERSAASLHLFLPLASLLSLPAHLYSVGEGDFYLPAEREHAVSLRDQGTELPHLGVRPWIGSGRRALLSPSFTAALSQSKTWTLFAFYAGNDKDFPLSCSPSPLGHVGDFQPVLPSWGGLVTQLSVLRETVQPPKVPRGTLLNSETVSSLAKGG